LSRTLMLTILNVIILPILKVIFIKTGILRKSLSLIGGRRDNGDVTNNDNKRRRVIHAPDDDSDVIDVLAWQVYHAIKEVGALNADSFVFS